MPSRIISTIILDLDGPLLDGKLRHYQCYADILESHGYKPLPMEDYWKMKRQRCSRKEQLAASGAETIYAEFLDEWIANIERPEYLGMDRVQEGALAKLSEWHKSGLKIVLVTLRNNRVALMEQLRVNGLLPYILSVVVCPHAGGGEGKAAEILREFPDVEPFSCLWVGDTEADAEGAKYLRCPVWLLTCGLRTREFLLSLQPEFITERIVDIDLGKVVSNAS